CKSFFSQDMPPWHPHVQDHVRRDTARAPDASSDDGERKEFPARRPDLDLGAHGGADAAVVARSPAAVFDLGARDGVLPVLPEPLAVEPGVEVVPRQDLVLLALARGVPVDVDAAPLGGGHPPLEGEVLAPAVETAAVLPDGADDGADPAVAARQQALPDGRLAVVVAVADGPAVLLVAAPPVAQHLEPSVDGLVVGLGGPLERGVRLGHEAADGDRAAVVARPGGLAARLDDLLGQVGD